MNGTVIGKYICFNVNFDYDLHHLQTIMCLLHMEDNCNLLFSFTHNFCSGYLGCEFLEIKEYNHFSVYSPSI